MLDIAQVYLSEVSTVKLHKEEASYYEARLIKRYIQPIQNRVLQNFKSSIGLRKYLEFQSNTTMYKRKTIIKF